MASFQYRAYDARGRFARGSLEAVSQDAASEALWAQGLTPFQLRSHEPSAKPWWQREVFGGRRALRSDLAAFTTELATFIGAEIALDDALRLLSDQATSTAMGELAGGPAQGCPQRRNAFRCDAKAAAYFLRRLHQRCQGWRDRGNPRPGLRRACRASRAPNGGSLQGPVGVGLPGDPDRPQLDLPGDHRRRFGAQHRSCLCRWRQTAAGDDPVLSGAAGTVAGGSHRPHRHAGARRMHGIGGLAPAGAAHAHRSQQARGAGAGRLSLGAGNRPFRTYARHLAARWRAAAAGSDDGMRRRRQPPRRGGHRPRDRPICRKEPACTARWQARPRYRRLHCA